MSWELERPSTSLKTPSTPFVSYTVVVFYHLLMNCIWYGTVDQENSEHAVCVIASKSFAAVQTESGKVGMHICI